MLRRGAACAFAACILVWPAGAGSDTDTFWSAPSAAVLGAISAPAIEPGLDPYQQQIAETAEESPTEKSAGKNQAATQNTARADMPAPLDPVQTKVAPALVLPPQAQPAPAPAQQQVASAAAEASRADKSDGNGEVHGDGNTHADGSARTATLDPAQPKSPSSPPVSGPFGL